jgi:hypothetical protein
MRLKRYLAFVSIPARIVGAIYLAISIGAFLKAMLRPSAEGGEWFVMYFIYWPVSRAVLLAREFLKQVVPAGVLHSFPTESFNLLNIFDGVSCVVAGAFWYYLITKTIHYQWATRGTRRQAGAKGPTRLTPGLASEPHDHENPT